MFSRNCPFIPKVAQWNAGCFSSSLGTTEKSIQHGVSANPGFPEGMELNEISLLLYFLPPSQQQGNVCHLHLLYSVKHRKVVISGSYCGNVSEEWERQREKICKKQSPAWVYVSLLPVQELLGESPSFLKYFCLSWFFLFSFLGMHSGIRYPCCLLFFAAGK